MSAKSDKQNKIIIKGVINKLERITKSEMEWLLANNYLTIKYGKIEYLIVTSRNRNKGHKDRYVSDSVYRHLSKMKNT